ncbi:MAG: hypothetical protein AB8H79_06005 [Myxococcota bacterium]
MAQLVGPQAGEHTKSIVLQELEGGFEVRALLSVDPGRWVYRAIRRDDPESTPLELIALSEAQERSLPQTSLVSLLEGRVPVRAPSLQRVFAAGRLDAERVYGIVEPLDGTSLVDTLAHGSLPLGRGLHLTLSLLRFLVGLRKAGVTSGPLTPSRVYLKPEWNGTDHVSVISTWFLSPEGPRYDLGPYASPEWRPGSDTAASDVFSLGAVMVRALSNQPAYSRAERSAAVRTGEPPHWKPLIIADSSEPAPAALDRLLRQMMSYDPGARPSNLSSVVETLEQLIETEVVPMISAPMIIGEGLTDAGAPVRQHHAAPPKLASVKPTAGEPAPPKKPTPPTPAARGATPAAEPHIGAAEEITEEVVEARKKAGPAVWFALAFGGTALLTVLLVVAVMLATGPGSTEETGLAPVIGGGTSAPDAAAASSTLGAVEPDGTTTEDAATDTTEPVPADSAGEAETTAPEAPVETEDEPEARPRARPTSRRARRPAVVVAEPDPPAAEVEPEVPAEPVEPAKPEEPAVGGTNDLLNPFK